jgi:hypothetical protein
MLPALRTRLLLAIVLWVGLVLIARLVTAII